MEIILNLMHAKECEINECYKILDDGRKFQRLQGFIQWNDTYPNLQTVIGDVNESLGYVIKLGDKIVSYCCIRFDGEPVYDDINGNWSSDEPYAVVHRLAISQDFRGQGLGKEVLRAICDYVKRRGINYLRVDTGLENVIMQRTLEKNGFNKCGTVCYYSLDTGLRYAYDKKI